MKKVTKKDIEEIIDRNLTNWEYNTIVTYIKYFRGERRYLIHWARHQR